MYNAGFNSTGSNGTTTGDGEYVFDRHEEVFIFVTARKRNPSVNSVHKFHDLLNPLRFIVQATQSGTLDNRSIVTVETVESQQFTDFHLNEFEQFGVVNHVNLVHENNHSWHTYLLSQKDVLSCLRHRTIGSSNNQDSTVHLSGTSYHVLNIVSVTRAVNVCIVTVSCLILNVSSIDGNTTFLFLRSVIDRIEASYF